MDTRDEKAPPALDATLPGVRARSRRPGEGLVRFREAAVRLSAVPDAEVHGPVEGLEAASALLEMAAGGDEAALRHVLRPDPRHRDVTWSVACYRIGDLTPSELRDFSGAVGACDAVARCREPSHVAAELVVSTAGGIRWTAAYRTGAQVTFQLPGEATASSASSADADGLAEAVEHWRRQLVQWAEDPHAPIEVDSDVETPAVPSAGRPADLTAEVDEATLTTVLERLDDLGRRLAHGRADAHLVAERLERIERQLADLLDRSPRGPTSGSRPPE